MPMNTLKKYILNILIIFLFLPYVATYSNNSKQTTQEKLNNFTDYANKIMADWHVPGMAIAIVENDKIIYERRCHIHILYSNDLKNKEIN